MTSTQSYEHLSDFNGYTGVKKLRCLGLSDPEKGTQDLGASFKEPDRVEKVLESIGEQVKMFVPRESDNIGSPIYPLKIILKCIQKKYEKIIFAKGSDFGSPIFLFKGNPERHPSFLQGGMYKVTGEGFSQSKNGYSYGHHFVKKKGSEVRIGATTIDSNAVDESVEDLGGVTFKALEKCLGTICSISHHDYTMHGAGIITNGKENIGEFLEHYLSKGFMEEVDGLTGFKGELLSAVLHKHVFDSLGASHSVLNSFHKNVNVFLDIISELSNKELADYWFTVMKYHLFSILDPEGIEIQHLAGKYPQFDFKSTRWGRAVSQKEIGFNIGKSKHSCQVPVDQVYKTLMPLLGNQEQFEKGIIQLIADTLGYSDIEDEHTLERIYVAGQLGVKKNTPKDIKLKSLDVLELYKELRFRIAGSPKINMFEQFQRSKRGDPDMYSTNLYGDFTSDQLYATLVMFSEDGYNTSEFDSIDWESIDQKNSQAA